MYYLSLSLYLYLSLSFCQFIFSHHSDQMSQRSKVSKIALWRCSLNVFVIFIVFVFVFVAVFLLFRSCFLKTPIIFARLGFGLEGFESKTMLGQLKLTHVTCLPWSWWLQPQSCWQCWRWCCWSPDGWARCLWQSTLLGTTSKLPLTPSFISGDNFKRRPIFISKWKNLILPPRWSPIPGSATWASCPSSPPSMSSLILTTCQPPFLILTRS